MRASDTGDATDNSPFCIEDMYPSFLKPSQIPDAGDGLFAARDIKQGELISVYHGFIQSIGRDATSEQKPYCIGIDYKSRRRVLVGIALSSREKKQHAHKGLAQMANDALMPCVSGYSNNSYFIQAGAQIELRALRDIHEQAEIFVPYGYGYWHNSHSLSTWHSLDEKKRRQYSFVAHVITLLETRLECFVVDIQDFRGHIQHMHTSGSEMFSDADAAAGGDAWLPLTLEGIELTAFATVYLTASGSYICPACSQGHSAVSIPIVLSLSETTASLKIECCVGFWAL